MRLLDDTGKEAKHVQGRPQALQDVAAIGQGLPQRQVFGGEKVLLWVERLDDKLTPLKLLGTQWKHIVDFNAKFYEVLVSYTELQPQTDDDRDS